MKYLLPKIGERVEFASHFVPNCEKLLDIGCGNGVLKEFVNDRVNKIYGIDKDKKMFLNVNKRKYFELKAVDLDKEKIPYENNYFDCITCLDVIEHVVDPNFLLSQVYRVLKQKGLFIISTPNIRFSDHLTKLLLKGIFPKTSLDNDLYDGGHIHFFTYQDLYNLLKKHKFSILKKEGIINKKERGWKGKMAEFFLGKQIMNEFRSPGILLIAQKV